MEISFDHLRSTELTAAQKSTFCHYRLQKTHSSEIWACITRYDSVCITQTCKLEQLEKKFAKMMKTKEQKKNLTLINSRIWSSVILPSFRAISPLSSEKFDKILREKNKFFRNTSVREQPPETDIPFHSFFQANYAQIASCPITRKVDRKLFQMQRIQLCLTFNMKMAKTFACENNSMLGLH